MDINYELYKVFYYVATTLSFSEASRHLFISQSAVSQSIKVLEKKPLNNSKAGGAKADMAKELKIDVYDMKIASPGGKNVSGILCVPQDKSRKYPAIVSFHGAGVRSAGAKLNSDAITFDVNAHGDLLAAGFHGFLQKRLVGHSGCAENDTADTD